MLSVFKIIKNIKIALAIIKLFCRGILSFKIYHEYCIHIRNLAGTDKELPEDDAVAPKHVEQCRKELYNKLLISCALVGSLYK